MSKKTDAPWFWLSFAERGKGFLGGCYVQAIDHGTGDIEPVLAVQHAHVLGINPGGEVRMLGPVAEEDMKDIPMEQRNRLLSKQDLIEIGGFVDNDGKDLVKPS